MRSFREFLVLGLVAFAGITTAACASTTEGDNASLEDEIRRGGLETTWVSLSPKQCGTNPWASVKAADESEQVVEYFKSQGIALSQVGFAKPPQPVMVCMACQCPRGDLLVVQAPSKTVAKQLITLHGFEATKRLTIAGAKQCGTSVWESGGSGGTNEQDQLVAWVTGKASVTAAGFVKPSTPAITCMACGCPRGDSAILVAERDQDVTSLGQHGFQVAK